MYDHNSQLCGYNYWDVCMLLEYLRQNCMLCATRPLMSVNNLDFSYFGCHLEK